MPTIIRKPQTLLVETKRVTFNTVAWHVRSNVWRPPTDVYETETSVIVKIEIAGMRDEDLEVAIQGNLMLISGVRSDSSGRRAYHQMEIPFGKFSVGVELPPSGIIEESTAEYKDGFLTVYLPKKKLDI
jgi:HSP20 family protein